MNVHRFSCSLQVAGLACLALLVLATPASAYVRTDVVDENYLTGYLYWENGKGRISWDSPHESEDDVDPGNNSAGLYDDFVSLPVPRTLYLNVSRVLQVDLFFKGSGVNNRVVELYSASAFLGGGSSDEGINYCLTPSHKTCADPSTRPAAPGYAVDLFRLQSELDTIGKGEIVKLRAIHRNSNAGQYGLDRDHASVLRIPLFSADEALFRIPKYSSQSQPLPPAGPVPNADPVTDLVNQILHPGGASLGLLIFATMARTSRKPRGAVFVVLVLAGSGLAGCMGSHPRETVGPNGSTGPGLGGSANVYFVRDGGNDTGLTTATQGSIYGVVSDTDNLPVNGAYVLVLGTTQSARTDPYGRFQFRDLAPGDYWLRIDRDGFKSFETTVRVEASSITKIEVVLEFVVVKDANARPHRHNGWFDKNGNPVDSMVIHDEADARIGSGALAPPLTILPGTRDIEINVTWNQKIAGGVANVRTVRGDEPYGNRTYLYPKPNGVPTHLRTTWEMTDPGHAVYTYWGPFAINSGPPDDTCPGPLVDQRRTACIRSGRYGEEGLSLRITITLHKGVLPLEPAHPDLWKGETSRGVIDNASGIGRFSNDGTSLFSYHNWTWEPPSFVPYETQGLTVRLVVNRALVYQSSDSPWALYFRTGEGPNYGDCDPHALQNAEASHLATVSAKDPATRTWEWQIPTAREWPDPPYAKRTNWCFYVTAADHNEQVLDDDVEGQASGTGLWTPISLKLNVTAHRDAIVTP